MDDENAYKNFHFLSFLGVCVAKRFSSSSMTLRTNKLGRLSLARHLRLYHPIFVSKAAIIAHWPLVAFYASSRP
jgi:hypothetical protein